MEDKEIITEILHKGDCKAYAEIVSRYSGVVYSKTIGVVRSDELAREIVQQAFIRAYTRLNSWRGESLGAWLSAIALHLSINYLDKVRRHRMEQLDANARQIEEEQYSDEHEQRLQDMENAIANLPDDERELIQMHYYKNMKTDEIAARTGLSQSNVLVKLHRIREKLRKELSNGRNE